MNSASGRIGITALGVGAEPAGTHDGAGDGTRDQRDIGEAEQGKPAELVQPVGPEL